MKQNFLYVHSVNLGGRDGDGGGMGNLTPESSVGFPVITQKR